MTYSHAAYLALTCSTCGATGGISRTETGLACLAHAELDERVAS